MSSATLGYIAAIELVTSLKIINLFDQEIQQHVFGDVMRRQMVGELRVGFRRPETPSRRPRTPESD